MFKPMLHKPYRVPAYACLIVAATLAYMVGVAAQAQAPNPAPAPPPTDTDQTLAYIKSMVGTITTVAGFVALIGGIVYGMLKKNNTERLKANIQELEDIVETKETRNKELRLQLEAQEAKAALRIERLEQEKTNLSVSNEAVVGHNLQMKAILKQLRLSGKWGGHEDSIFLHQTKG